MLAREAQEPQRRCARCRKGAPWTIWGVDVCDDCAARWELDVSDALRAKGLAQDAAALKQATTAWARSKGATP